MSLRERTRPGLGCGADVRKREKPPDAIWTTSPNVGTYSLVFDEHEIVQLLKAAVQREGDQGAFARRHDIDRSYLNQMLNGKKAINSAILKSLGLRKVYAPE